MKRYITGILAVIIAVSAVAFIMPKKVLKTLDEVAFYYQSTNFSSAEVAKKENWSSTVTPPTCVGTQNKACKLLIDIVETTETGGVRFLTNNISVMPGAGGATNGYVPDPSTQGYVERNDKP